jgi:hypothetical protein
LTNKKQALFPRNHRQLVSPEIMVFCSHPIAIGACCMLSGRLRGFIPQKLAHFEEHILTLHTVRWQRQKRQSRKHTYSEHRKFHARLIFVQCMPHATNMHEEPVLAREHCRIDRRSPVILNAQLWDASSILKARHTDTNSSFQGFWNEVTCQISTKHHHLCNLASQKARACQKQLSMGANQYILDTTAT